MPDRLLPRLCITLLFASVVSMHAVAIRRATERPTPPTLVASLDAYLAGRYDTAVKGMAAVDDLGPFRLRFVLDVPFWINLEPERVEQRRAAAAAFLLELTHARLESDWLRFVDLIEWMCLNLRSGHPEPAFERAWHHASVALAGRARSRFWLLGEFAVLPHQKPMRVREQPKDPSPRHLMHVLERFPDDVHLQLARIVAWTWGRDREPTRNVERPAAPTTVTRRPPQMEAIVALQPLVDAPAVGAEALARIGQLHLTAGDYGAALRSFEAADARAADRVIQYAARFLAGRSLEALQRPVDAATQYQRALDVWPSAESATVALASLRFVNDDRAVAVTLLREKFASPPQGDDPGRLISYGSFMHWPALRAAMRAELPR